MVFTIRNLFMKPVSAVLRERLGAFIMATNMTNSEAMVTSAAPYTTESKQTYPQILNQDLGYVLLHSSLAGKTGMYVE